jgi:hypothetical protein
LQVQLIFGATIGRRGDADNGIVAAGTIGSRFSLNRASYCLLWSILADRLLRLLTVGLCLRRLIGQWGPMEHVQQGRAPRITVARIRQLPPDRCALARSELTLD